MYSEERDYRTGNVYPYSIINNNVGTLLLGYRSVRCREELPYWECISLFNNQQQCRDTFACIQECTVKRGTTVLGMYIPIQ